MPATVPEISVGELQALMSGGTAPRIIDVRERDEWEICRIPGAELIPLSEWPQRALEKLADRSEPLVMQCHHGARSARAAKWLLEQGYAEVRNLAGGIDAWSVQIDPTVARYE